MYRLFSKNLQMLETTSKSVTIQRNLCATINMANRLKGKVAVVTASSDGIGFAIAQRLGREGASVVVSSRKQKNIDAAVLNLKKLGVQAIGVKCHVANAEDRKSLFEETVKSFGGIDILISNAAVNPEVGAVLDASESAWDKIFEVNVKASYLLAKEVLPFIRKRGGGSIVFVSSIAGFKPFSLLGAYSVSKTALFGLTKAAAQDLAPENIRVNCVAPGIVQTKFAAAVSYFTLKQTHSLIMVFMLRSCMNQNQQKKQQFQRFQ